MIKSGVSDCLVMFQLLYDPTDTYIKEVYL